MGATKNVKRLRGHFQSGTIEIENDFERHLPSFIKKVTCSYVDETSEEEDLPKGQRQESEKRLVVNSIPFTPIFFSCLTGVRLSLLVTGDLKALTSVSPQPNPETTRRETSKKQILL